MVVTSCDFLLFLFWGCLGKLNLKASAKKADPLYGPSGLDG